MLEVVFSSSTKGSMKIAKNYKETSNISGPIIYIGEKPKKVERKKHFEGKAIGGSSEDVVCIGFNLDIGDISGELNGIERRNIFQPLEEEFYTDNNEQERFFTNQRQDMEKLMSAAKSGIPIRMWTSNTPYSTCGFYFVCNALRDIDCEISVVSLPFYNVTDNQIVTYSDWGQIEPGKFYGFLPLERQLSQMEKRLLSSEWCNLVKENSPLRAIVNGKLISVPEDFYDHILLKNIPDDEFLMARLIGKILGNYELGVGDGWYALRIIKMIDENKLIVIENKENSHVYSKILKKNYV
ncbi:hypothetical protein SH1V18_13030 [Vallitalea longa]|uniref:DUF1835 domain-containing protein n=1 Tax=Vallitalea longa TaxID=2936439 RepID=A0A9W5YAI4_9FIRM|nr:DUF3658 domain-containing protein [Vallitalea longa]GKX28823.1 hypothetical protein SH1V18_13030 [Vallitalea longa]